MITSWASSPRLFFFFRHLSPSSQSSSHFICFLPFLFLFPFKFSRPCTPLSLVSSPLVGHSKYIAWSDKDSDIEVEYDLSWGWVWYLSWRWLQPFKPALRSLEHSRASSPSGPTCSLQSGRKLSIQYLSVGNHDSPPFIYLSTFCAIVPRCLKKTTTPYTTPMIRTKLFSD